MQGIQSILMGSQVVNVMDGYSGGKLLTKQNN